jgi:hypothetical protein
VECHCHDERELLMRLDYKNRPREHSESDETRTQVLQQAVCAFNSLCVRVCLHMHVLEHATSA